jgi:hypothetical protein
MDKAPIQMRPSATGNYQVKRQGSRTERIEPRQTIGDLNHLVARVPKSASYQGTERTFVVNYQDAAAHLGGYLGLGISMLPQKRRAREDRQPPYGGING